MLALRLLTAIIDDDGVRVRARSTVLVSKSICNSRSHQWKVHLRVSLVYFIGHE
jgi:hypothetical protein